jgi:alpha-glucosidase
MEILMPRRFSSLTLIFLAFSFCSIFAANGPKFSGPISAVREIPGGVSFRSGAALVRITTASPGVVRLRYTTAAQFPPDHSFAVVPNPDLPKAQPRLTRSQRGFELDTGDVRVRVDRATGGVAFLDRSGNLLSQDQPGYPVTWHDNAFRIYKSMPVDEQYFGLGDKSDGMDHRGNAFTMWTTDAFGWEQGTDPLYKSIPFFIALKHGAAYGTFLDNTYKSSFDFGKESRDFYSFGSDGGELNYYFIAGPQPKQVIERYTALTGRTPLPPLYTLAYQQCRYSYYPESRVREIASEFRKRRIPADVLYLDIDYQDGYKPFTINRKYFPHFEQMIKDLGAEGFRVVVISDLHIPHQPGYAPYDSGHAEDVFVKNPDGTEYVGNVWPGPSVFPDFTLKKARQWYGSQYKFFTDMGIAGFWNDMNEPAVFRYPDKSFPIDTVHRVDSETENRNPAGPIRKTDHREIHNVVGMENVRATYEGLLTLRPNERPFVLTRAAFAGTQRYAATWTGDNQSTWAHYRLTLPTLLNMGVSGYSSTGVDVGGFDGSPEPDLLTRWTELGAFLPIFRNHTAVGTRDQEPWVHGPEHEAINRRYIELRYRLLPYIYTTTEEMSRTGVPVMRAFFLEHPDLGRIQNINDREFFFGPDFLVAPKLKETLDNYEVIFPNGIWYDYWTGKKIEANSRPAWDTKSDEVGPKNPPDILSLSANPPLDTLPVYVRGGAIIPEQPLVQTTMEKPNGPLELRVYPGPNCSGSIYADDGTTFAYKQGAYFRQNFTCEVTPSGVTVNLAAPEGTFTPWWTQVRAVVYGPTGPLSRDLPFSRSEQSVAITY